MATRTRPRTRTDLPDLTDEPNHRDRPAPRTRTGAGRAVAGTVVVTLLVVAVAALAVLLYVRSDQLSAERDVAADRAKAEKIASEYAVKAATIDYRDLTPWLNAMKSGVTPELARKYDAIGDTLRQVVVPLRMTATGKTVMAQTATEVNGVYQVKVAVDVSAQSLQAQQGTVSTTVYSVTVDRGRDWVITEVGDSASPNSVLTGSMPTGAAAPSAAPSAAAPAVPSAANPTEAVPVAPHP